MSLEAALIENTATMRELIAALTAAGTIQTAQVSAAAASSPAVKAVVKAQKELAEKEAAATAKTPAARVAQTESAAGARSEEVGNGSPSGEPLTADQVIASVAAVETPLQAWHEKTAKLYGELKDGEPSLDNVRKAVLGINSLLGQPAGREQATALLGRFGAKAVTFKPEMPDKPGLNADQFPAVFAMALEVLAGRLDVTASMEGAA